MVGFVGGVMGHNDPIHNEVQLARRLRNDYAATLYVLTFENRRGGQAHQEVLRLLDSNHDGRLSLEEKKKARIAIYGHSWGASEAVTLARALQEDGIAVLLTIQVDSVHKPREDDQWIPPNVKEAVNFYQPDGMLRGRREIRAADPSRTRILGNIQVDYKSKKVSCEGYPWYAHVFAKPHMEIECDPSLWGQVEALIRSRMVTGL